MRVSNLSVVIVAYVPGNIIAGNWDAVVLIDERATSEQREARLVAFGGQLGGPIADWASLIGIAKGVEYAPISHRVAGGVGTLEIGEILDAQMEPYRNADGTVTTLRDSVFSAVPGSPAWVSKASQYRLSLTAFGWEWQSRAQCHPIRLEDGARGMSSAAAGIETPRAGGATGPDRRDRARVDEQETSVRRRWTFRQLVGRISLGHVGA